MSGRRQTQQKDLSQTLSLLESLNYQGTETRSNVSERLQASDDEMKLLNTIALCLATGNPGDVVASAIRSTEKGDKIIYLSKNGEPSSKDINSAQGFLRTLERSKNNSLVDILPWIASYSTEMVQHRVNKLQCLVSKEKNAVFRQFLNSKISSYHSPHRRAIEAEFPSFASAIYLNSEGYKPQQIIETSTVQTILFEILARFDAGLNFNTETSSHWRLHSLVFATATLRQSTFLKELIKYVDTNSSKKSLLEITSKFIRNMNKVYQYIRITDLIRYVQSQGPFKIVWVCKAIMGNTLCYEFRGLELQSASATASGIVKRLKLTQLTPERLRRCFHILKPSYSSSEREDPLKERQVNTCVHAELKLVVFLLSRTPPRSQNQEVESRAIGCSKRSCLYCTLWINELQKILDPTVHRFMYYTAGSHGHAYATCARVGPFKEDPTGLCSNEVERILKGLTDGEVSALLNVKPGHIKNKKSEDHASASEDDADLIRFS